MLASFLRCHSTTEFLNLIVGVSTRGLMCGIKIPLQDFALKMQGGLCASGGVFAGHYSSTKLTILIQNHNGCPTGKDRSVRACQMDEKHFIGLVNNPIINDSNVHTSTSFSINTKDDRLMCSKVVRTSCEVETQPCY